MVDNYPPNMDYGRVNPPDEWYCEECDKPEEECECEK